MPDGRLLVPQERLDELEILSRGGTPVLLAPTLFRLLLSHIALLGEALELYAGDYCVVCGCTGETACEGGCSWAAVGLCSSCVKLDGEELDLVARDAGPLVEGVRRVLALTGDEPMDEQDEAWAKLSEAAGVPDPLDTSAQESSKR